MPRLEDARRWVNHSNLSQKVLNSKTAAYQEILPNGVVEGAQFAAPLKHNRNFHETLQHLTERELVSLIQEDNDVELLRWLSKVEQYTPEPRKPVLKMFEARIRVLEGNKQNANAVGKNS